MAPSTAPFGPLLREWRQRRRYSQLDLAIEAGVSARHLSFVETGRSTPSADMVMHLAEWLEVPLRERNRLLLAAGYAPRFGERTLDDPDMASVREAVQTVIDGHDPHPAVVVDRHWELMLGNRNSAILLEGVAPELLAPPINALRLSLHPDGAAPRIANFAQWRAHLLDRLARQVTVSGDAQLTSLLQELQELPGPERPDDGANASSDIFVPLRLKWRDQELSFISTITTFGTATDITVAELSIESFFPADDATSAALRST